MPHSNLDWYVLCGVAALALLAGRQRTVKIVAVLAVMAGIGIGTTPWGREVWPAISDLAARVS